MFGNRRQSAAQLAALELAVVSEVGDVGLEQASISGACRRADLDGEAFHRHFSSLEDACQRIFEKLVGEALARILREFDAQQSWRDQVRAGAYALCDFFEEDRRQARFMMIECLKVGERVQLIRDGGLEILVDLIDRVRAAPEYPVGKRCTRATAEAIVGACYRRGICAIENGDQALEPLIPELMYSVVQPYLGIEEALRELEIGGDRQLA